MIYVVSYMSCELLTTLLLTLRQAPHAPLVYLPHHDAASLVTPGDIPKSCTYAANRHKRGDGGGHSNFGSFTRFALADPIVSVLVAVSRPSVCRTGTGPKGWPLFPVELVTHFRHRYFLLPGGRFGYWQRLQRGQGIRCMRAPRIGGADQGLLFGTSRCATSSGPHLTHRQVLQHPPSTCCP